MTMQICGVSVPRYMGLGAPICGVGGFVFLGGGLNSLASGGNSSLSYVVTIAGFVSSLASGYFCYKIGQIWKNSSPLSGGLINPQTQNTNYQTTVPSITIPSQVDTISPESHYNLGNHYLFGDGVKDEFKAAEHYKKAAIGGHAQAQHMLAKCYMNSAGVPENHVEAIKWTKKAADAGIVPAKKVMSIYNEIAKKGSGATTTDIVLDLYDDSKIELKVTVH